MLTTNKICKFARKTREYKLTYSLIFIMSGGEDESTGEGVVEHITKLLKAHRSAMDADYAFFIVKS